MNNNNSVTTKNTSLAFVCIAIILVAVNMRSPIVLVGSIAPVIEQALSISQLEIGWLGAIPMFSFAFGALVSAKFSKWFGIHNLLPVMILLLALGMVLRVFAVGWWWFFAGTAILSLAIGFLNTITMPAIKQLAPKNIPLVTGLYSLAMTIMAGLVAGIVLPMSDLLGWRLATGVWAVLSVFAFVFWWQLRPNLVLDYQQQQHSNRTVSDSNSPQVVIQKRQQMPDSKHNKSMWQTPMAWWLAIFLGLQSLMYYLVASFLPSIWASKGLSLIQAGQLAMLFQLMAPIAILLLTWVMSRKDHARMMAMLASILIAMGAAGMAFGRFDVNPLFWASVWTICAGFGASLVFTLTLMLINLRTYDTMQASELSSMSQAIGYTIAMAGPLGAGWLHEVSGDWHLPLTVLTILMLINIGFAWAVSGRVMIDGKPF